MPYTWPVERTGGRETWRWSADGSQCTLLTRHIAFSPGVGTFECAAFTVQLPEVGAPCEAAEALAAEAWGRLPS